MRYAKAQKRRQMGSSLLTVAHSPFIAGLGVVLLLRAVTGLFNNEDAA